MGDAGARAMTATCENCGSIEVQTYCAACGQRKLSPRRPLGLVIGDALGTALALDGKLLRTLIGLLFVPGKITRAFIEGKRERYSPPFRLFFFVGFAFFLYLSFVTGTLQINAGDATPDPTVAEQTQPPEPTKIEINTGLDTSNPVIAQLESELKTRAQRVIDQCRADGVACFKHFAAQFQWILYAMAPLFGVVISIMFFWKRGYYGVDGVVFSLHNHAFVFLCIMLTWPLNAFPVLGIWPGLLLAAWMAYWFFAAVQRVYQTSWPVTLFALPAMLIVWIVAFTLAATVTLLAGLVTI
jgi:hypothetical protein